jgi:hypothetical protein
VPACLDRGREHALHPVCEGDGRLLVQSRGDDDELVAAEPRHHVDVAAGCGETARHGPQQFVPGAAPERVVDHLEPVQVQEQDRDGRLGGELVLEELGQRCAVWQAGQRVGEREAREPVLLLYACGDVARRGLDLDHSPVRTGHRPAHRHDPDPPALAVRRAVPQRVRLGVLDQPLVRDRERGKVVGVHCRGVAPVAEQLLGVLGEQVTRRG